MNYYDRQGRPMTLEEWAAGFERDAAARRVAADRVGPYWISTVWLGLDHGFGRTEAPIIFETMVFLDDGHDDEQANIDLECLRYSTEAQALAGHQEMVTLVRATTRNLP